MVSGSNKLNEAAADIQHTPVNKCHYNYNPAKNIWSDMKHSWACVGKKLETMASLLQTLLGSSISLSDRAFLAVQWTVLFTAQ